jgi:hypothetical protein
MGSRWNCLVVVYHGSFVISGAERSGYTIRQALGSAAETIIECGRKAENEELEEAETHAK